jgi:D-alanyl-D-alanine carboxypeptidase/D-alanyl-D-alanine-endopeptidase (penicillin-binding protein 4)
MFWPDVVRVLFLAWGVTLIARAAPAPARSVAELAAQIEAHLAQPRFNGALWGVKVGSLETGRTLFEHHPERLMSPASNSKLYTGALALDLLGGEYQIVTPVFATSKPDEAGRVAGSVIVSGRGDPSWKAEPRGGDFWKTFDRFVGVLAKAGVRHVTGDIVADSTFFRGPPYGAGWAAEDLNEDYGAEISAITLEDNFVDLQVRPASVAGRACELELLHPCSGLTLQNHTLTVARGGARSIHARRNLGDNIVHVLGGLPGGGEQELLDVPVPNAARWFAAALQEALGRAGITVAGGGRGVNWPSPSPLGSGAVKLGEIRSPPLRTLVRAFMKPSQNLETDLIFAHLGETQRPADAPTWRTSEQCGVSALREFLQRRQLPVDEVRFDEGSGLSRNNLTTANATVALLTLMAAHREAKVFYDALPIAGVDGTIRRRMAGTVGEGNVRAKTGTLRWANALSGYVTSAAGERMVFSVMLNRSVTPAGRFARDDVDAIAVMLAQFSARSGSAVSSDASPARP